MKLIEKEIESIFLTTVKKIYAETDFTAVQIQPTNNEKESKKDLKLPIDEKPIKI